MRIDDFHSNYLVGKSSIPIPILRWNGNGLMYIELNPYSPLWIQISILIPISISISSTDQDPFDPTTEYLSTTWGQLNS